MDPFDGCSFTVGDGLEIEAANGRGIWWINLSAPRLLRPTSGNWAVQAACGPASGEKPAIGGLLVWQDKKNYLRLDRGVLGEPEVLFWGYRANEDLVFGRGRLPLGASKCAFLRLERNGELVNAFCSPDGESWFTVEHVRARSRSDCTRSVG